MWSLMIYDITVSSLYLHRSLPLKTSPEITNSQLKMGPKFLAASEREHARTLCNLTMITTQAMRAL